MKYPSLSEAKQKEELIDDKFAFCTIKLIFFLKTYWRKWRAYETVLYGHVMHISIILLQIIYNLNFLKFERYKENSSKKLLDDCWKLLHQTYLNMRSSCDDGMENIKYWNF